MGRRVLAWVVAALVTAGLVAGGVLVARDRGEPSPAVLPALDLGEAGPAAAGSSGTGANDAAGAIEPAPAPGGTGAARSSGGASDRRLLWPPVTYKLGGPLPSLPGQAQAWKLGDNVDAGRVATLAAALGLAGTPKQEPNGWSLQDGRRALVVHRLAGVPWSYGSGIFGTCVGRAGGPYRPGPGIQCLDPDAPVSNQPGSVAPTRPFRPPDLPSRAEAEQVARDLAARAGLDLDGAQVKVGDSLATRTVTIAPAVGGMPTSGFAWTVSVGPKGVVQHASGYLATPEPAGTYPLVGVEQGFERLKRSGPLGGVARPGSPAVELDPCPGGGKVPCTDRLKARVATVTGARLGLQLAPVVTEGDGRPGVAYLLPTYLFDLEGGWTDVRAIIAVPDRYLTRPSP